MPVHANTNILTLSNTQAKELAGRVVTIGGATGYFKCYDSAQPGQPPWRSGAEGKAYPLLDQDGSVAAYLKFFTHPTQKRLDRTAWLIGQKMHAWLPNLAAAPLLWTDTRDGLHGAKIDFQFTAYLSTAVPGETWLEQKNDIAGGGTLFPEDLRWRCVKDLLLALAALEQAELVHGDLSPNNVILDLDAQQDAPMLYLIDFDAFFATAAGANRAVTVAEGGTYGTEGYCPPDLAAAASAGDGSATPYSDRYGRDMLLLEFLLMGRSMPADDPLAYWNREQLQRQFTAWQARSDRKWVQTLCHLDPITVFKLSEPERPTSVDLAVGLGLSLPERRVLHRVTELPRPTPAFLGDRPTFSEMARLRRRTATPGQVRGRTPAWAVASLPPLRRHQRVQFKEKIGEDDLESCLAVVIAIFLFFLLGFLVSLWAGTYTPVEDSTAKPATSGNRIEDPVDPPIRRSIGRDNPCNQRSSSRPVPLRATISNRNIDLGSLASCWRQRSSR